MKTVLITGVAGGMGYETTKRLLADGMQVWGLDIHAPEHCEGLHFLPTDLTDAAAVEQAFETLRTAGVTLDGIVHMAGMYELDSLVEMDEAAWDRVFQVNLYAAFRVNRCFLPLLSGGARIVLTTSELAPLDPLPFTGIYAITKSALDKYAASLRMELQLLGHPVIVLRPGAVATQMLGVSTSRLQTFCDKTTHYTCNAERFREIVERVEARSIPPQRVAALVSKILHAKHPRPVYKINRNPLLLLLNALPLRWQCAIIRWILKTA